MDPRTAFLYVVIIVVCIAIWRRLCPSVGLNIVLGIAVALILIMYWRGKADGKESHLGADEVDEAYQDVKARTIRPPLGNIEGNPDLVDFLFSVRELYSFSPPNFEDLVDSLQDFLTLCSEAEKIKGKAGVNYGLCEQKRSDALNSLHSLTFSLPSVVGGHYTDKLGRAHRRLDFLLSSYLRDLSVWNSENLAERGYSTRTVVIDTGPKASNYYSEGDGKYTYELY